jgi:hypothetical protein
MGQRRLQDDIVATLRAARAAERDIIGALPQEVRLAPGPERQPCRLELGGAAARGLQGAP